MLQGVRGIDAPVLEKCLGERPGLSRNNVRGKYNVETKTETRRVDHNRGHSDITPCHKLTKYCVIHYPGSHAEPLSLNEIRS